MIWATLSTRQSRTRPPPPDQPRCLGWGNPRGLSADEECRVQGLPRAEVAPIHAVGQPQADRQRPTFQHHHDGGWTVDQGVGSRAPPASAAADWFTPSKAAARSLVTGCWQGWGLALAHRKRVNLLHRPAPTSPPAAACGSLPGPSSGAATIDRRLACHGTQPALPRARRGAISGRAGPPSHIPDTTLDSKPGQLPLGRLRGLEAPCKR